MVQDIATAHIEFRQTILESHAEVIIRLPLPLP